MPAPPDERLVALLLRGNRVLWDCLDRLSALELPNWYLGAGCVAQTVWNAAHGKALGSDIADYDFVYFDAADLTQEGENAVATRARSAAGDLPIHLDVKNQARVHRWYPRHFGYAIEPYTSAEDAIRTWPTTATAVGVRLEHGAAVVFAPFGLRDLFSLIVRPNRTQITQQIYQRKVTRWIRHWPQLTILPWSAGIGTPDARAPHYPHPGTSP